MSEYMDLAEERTAYVRALEDAVERLCRAFSGMPEVRRAVLFGSFAAGCRDLTTDLDVLVEMESSRDFVTRTARLYQMLDVGVDLDLFVYTPPELAEMEPRGFIRRALAEGKVIYEKDASRRGAPLARSSPD